MDTFVPQEARLGNKESVLVGVEMTREIQVINVNGLAATFQPEGNNQIEFTWTSSESNDFANSYVEFDFQYRKADGNIDPSACLNNFADCIDRVELYLDSQQLFSTSSREISLIQNLLLVSEASKHYLENEGKFHLGYNSQTVGNWTTAVETTKFDPTVTPADVQATSGYAHQARVLQRGRLGATASGYTRVHIPLFSLHMALGSMDGYLPVLGSQLRMILHLNAPKRVLSIASAADSTYAITQARLYVQEVVLSADYKAALMEKVSSAEGLSIHYYDVDVTQMAPVANASSHQFIVRNDHSNAKSLYMFDVDTAAGPFIGTASTFIQYPSMRSRLGVVTDIARIESGNRLFTGVNGSVGTNAHYNHLLRCAGKLADISSMGSIGTSYYRVGAGTAAAQEATVFSPLGFNLEKATLRDTDSTIINAGLSANDPMVSRDIDVRLDMSVAWNANWKLFAFLLHSKTLVFSNKSVSVVD
jgi:hypothetical protein